MMTHEQIEIKKFLKIPLFHIKDKDKFFPFKAHNYSKIRLTLTESYDLSSLIKLPNTPKNNSLSEEDKELITGNLIFRLQIVGGITESVFNILSYKPENGIFTKIEIAEVLDFSSEENKTEPYPKDLELLKEFFNQFKV